MCHKVGVHVSLHKYAYEPGAAHPAARILEFLPPVLRANVARLPKARLDCHRENPYYPFAF